MIFIKVAIFLLFFFTSNISYAQSNQIKIKIINNLPLLIWEDRTSPLITMQLWVGTGSTKEKDEEAGFAHFLEHLTFRSKDIAKRIEDHGGDINAYTSLDRTVYYLTIPNEYYEEGIKVLSDIFYSTDFSEESFTTEKDVILEEMKRSFDDPQRVIYKSFFENTIKNHPAKRPVIGYDKTIKDAKKSDIMSFYKKFYTSENSFLVIVGNIPDYENLEKKISTYFKSKKKAIEISKETPKKEFETNSGLFIKQKNIKTCYLMLGFPTPSIYDEDVPAIDVLSYIYGESPNSILNEELKEKKQLVNYIYSYQLSIKDFGFFIIQSNFSCKNINSVIEEIYKKVLIDDVNIESKNLKNVLKNYETGYLFSREKYSDLASDIGHSYFYFKDPYYSKKYIDLIKKVSLDDIKNVRNKYLRPEKMSLTLLIPEELDANQIYQKINTFLNKNLPNKENREEIVNLNNHIKISVHKKNNTQFFAINIGSLAGMRLETPELAGLSYFVASSILRGTKNRTYKEILNELESMGGTLSGYSTKNITGINGKFLTEDFEKSISLIADILTNFNPPKEEIEKVKKLILEEIKRKKEKPTNVLKDLYFSEVFKGTIFAYPTEGLEETIIKFDEKNVKDMFFNIFSPDKLYIALAGELPNNYLEILKKYFEKIPLQNPISIKSINPAKEIKNAVQTSNFNQAHILLGFEIPGITSPLRPKFHILSQILSNQSGRLFINLRDKKGLAYTVGAFLFEFPESSFFNLYIATSQEKVDIAKDGLLNEIKDLFSNGVSKEEIEKSKNQLFFNYAEMMQKSTDISSNLLQNHIYFNNPFYLKNFIDEIKKLDSESFLNDLKDFFDEKRAFFIVLTGKEG